MFGFSRKIVLAVAAVMTCLLLTACGGNDKELLGTPEVGDKYAAELTHFETFESKSGKVVETGYGLMKVTKVTDKEITVITSNWYNENRRGLEKELTKYQRGSEWDLTSGSITIARADLLKLYDEGKIFSVYRPKVDKN